jgi:hypothetical protein
VNPRAATAPTVPEGLCSSCTFYGPVFVIFTCLNMYLNFC